MPIAVEHGLKDLRNIVKFIFFNHAFILRINFPERRHFFIIISTAAQHPYILIPVHHHTVWFYAYLN